MDIAVETKIRERAYAFWLESGMGEGEAEHHWLHAEQAVRNESTAVAKSAVAKKAVKTKTAETKTAKASTAKGQAGKAAAPRRAKASAAIKAAEAAAC